MRGFVLATALLMVAAQVVSGARQRPYHICTDPNQNRSPRPDDIPCFSDDNCPGKKLCCSKSFGAQHVYKICLPPTLPPIQCPNRKAQWSFGQKSCTNQRQCRWGKLCCYKKFTSSSDAMCYPRSYVMVGPTNIVG